MTDTTKNQGTLLAAQSTTRYYWSPDSVLNVCATGCDTLIGSRTVNPLAGGASSNGSMRWTATTAGIYYIIVRADDDSSVLETDENDNIRVFKITVK